MHDSVRRSRRDPAGPCTFLCAGLDEIQQAILRKLEVTPESLEQIASHHGFAGSIEAIAAATAAADRDVTDRQMPLVMYALP